MTRYHEFDSSKVFFTLHALHSYSLMNCRKTYHYYCLHTFVSCDKVKIMAVVWKARRKYVDFLEGKNPFKIFMWSPLLVHHTSILCKFLKPVSLWEARVWKWFGHHIMQINSSLGVMIFTCTKPDQIKNQSSKMVV